MKVYFSVSQLPELASLKVPQQHLVKAHILEKIREANRWIPRLPVLMSVLGGIVGWFAFPFLAPLIHSEALRGISANSVSLFALYAALGMGAGSSVGGFIGNQVLISKVRPLLKQEMSHLNI